mmetsp:Transcript_9377/g.18287  ORF Transcript_9377/g.18287 Transcript_9377/m.18287 type:complete len:204 (-) Transcript_9377:33-644(-)
MNVNMHMAIIAAVAVIRLHDHPLSAEAQTQNFLNILSRCLPTPESFLLMTTTMKPTSADIRAKTNIDSIAAPASPHTSQKSVNYALLLHPFTALVPTWLPSLHSELLYRTSFVPWTPHSTENSALYSSSPQNVRLTHPVLSKSSLEKLHARSDPLVPPNAAPVATTARKIKTKLTMCRVLSLQPLLMPPVSPSSLRLGRAWLG